MSDSYKPVHPHGELVEVFPDVYQVTGSIRMQGFQFSRNMTVLRHDGQLTLLNSVRLDEAGLASLRALGEVAHVIKLGGFHGYDDRFYVETFGARYHQIEGDRPAKWTETHSFLNEESALPIPDASLFVFRTPTIAEALLRLDREGGVLVSCDALQNWIAPEPYFNLFAKVMMRFMGFFSPTNVGPMWRKQFKVQAEDFERLQPIPFEHVLCGHGPPVIGDAKARYAPAIRKHFGVG